MKKIINLERFIKNKTIREWVEALLFASIVAFIFRTWAYAPFRIPTGSMIPTIQIGDHIFANKHAYGFSVPFTDIKFFRSHVKRGDVVIFPYPVDPSDDYIKRAIATGGDSIELVGEKIFINGVEEKGGYAYYDPDFLSPHENRKINVPEGKIWVMGDNRRNSKDSRYWGFVDEKKIVGKASIIYWSHDPSQGLFGGYNLSRIGTLFDIND